MTPAAKPSFNPRTNSFSFQAAVLFDTNSARLSPSGREGLKAVVQQVTAEHRYGRKVAWGARCGSAEQIFTSLSVPVMTRLRQNERQVLDTLVDAGVARSRSDALAWCVRLVGEHAEDWLSRLREAMQAVEQVRAEGPGAG